MKKVLQRMQMIPAQLRDKRIRARIPGHVLSASTGISTGRISMFERGLVTLRPGEIERLSTELDRLIDAKAQVDAFAAQIGWPTVGAV